MKKIIALILALVMAVSFVACGNKTEQADSLTDVEVNGVNTSVKDFLVENLNKYFQSEKFLDMSEETLRDLILTVTPPEKYYYSATVTWADGDERFTVAQIYYLVSGDKLHGEIYTATTMAAGTSGPR